MEKEMYQVFEINTNFDEWAMDFCLVGAKDKQDLIDHLKEIFTLTEEECDDEVLDITRDVIGPMLDEDEFEEICKDDGDFQRILEIKNLYTDKPYEIITNYSYME